MRAQWVCSRERRITLYKRSSIHKKQQQQQKTLGLFPLFRAVSGATFWDWHLRCIDRLFWCFHNPPNLFRTQVYALSAEGFPFSRRVPFQQKGSLWAEGFQQKGSLWAEGFPFSRRVPLNVCPRVVYHRRGQSSQVIPWGFRSDLRSVWLTHYGRGCLTMQAPCCVSSCWTCCSMK